MRTFRPWWVLLGYAVLAIVWWWSGTDTWTTSVPGLGGDPFQTLWRLVRLGEVLREGSLTIPEEAQLRNFGPLPWLPVHALFGEVVTYHVAWLVSAVLSGWCTYLLARAWGARLFPALLAGVLVEFSPYRLSQALGHFGAMQLWWIPATLLALTIWGRRRMPLWGILAVVLIVGAAWTEHQLFLSLLATLLVLGAWQWRRVLAHVRAVPITSSVVLALVVACTVLPFLPTLSLAYHPESFFNLGQEQRERFSATVTTLFSPPPFHALRSGLSGYGTETSTAADHVHTLGLLLVVATMWTLRSGKVTTIDGALLTVAGVGVLLALGPVAHLDGVTIPLPGTIIDRLPVVSAIRAMGRFVTLAVVALPVLLALRWHRISPWRTGTAGLALLLVLEILPTPGFPRIPVGRPELVTALSALPEGGVLVIPAFSNYRVGSEHLYLSAFHRHPVVGNSALERALDPKARARFLETPVVRDLATLRLDDFAVSTFFGQRLRDIAPAAFASQEIRAIVYDTGPPGGVVSLAHNTRRELSPAEREAIREFLRLTIGLPEERISDTVFLYRIPPVVPADTPVVALRGSGWKLHERSPDMLRTEVLTTAVITLYAVRPIAAPAQLTARVHNRGEATELRVVSTSGESIVRLPESGVVTLPLGAPPAGFSDVEIHVDAEGLLLENPRILLATEGS